MKNLISRQKLLKGPEKARVKSSHCFPASTSESSQSLVTKTPGDEGGLTPSSGLHRHYAHVFATVCTCARLCGCSYTIKNKLRSRSIGWAYASVRLRENAHSHRASVFPSAKYNNRVSCATVLGDGLECGCVAVWSRHPWGLQGALHTLWVLEKNTTSGVWK